MVDNRAHQSFSCASIMDDARVSAKNAETIFGDWRELAKDGLELVPHARFLNASFLPPVYRNHPVNADLRLASCCQTNCGS